MEMPSEAQREKIEREYRSAEEELMDAVREFEDWKRSPKNAAEGAEKRSRVVKALASAKEKESRMISIGWEIENPIGGFGKKALSASAKTKALIARERLKRTGIRPAPLRNKMRGAARRTMRKIFRR